jgi:hypothetical protein
VRLGRTSWLGATAAVVAVAGALLFQSSAPVVSKQVTDPDSVIAGRFLAGIRGTRPLACEMVIRSLGVGWGWRSLHAVPDAASEQLDLLRWSTRRPSDPGVVPALRAGLEDSDPCVRRVAARLLGRTRLSNAVQALLDALASADPGTRQLAAVGLGYAEDRSTVDPLLRTLRAEEPSVRAAAAWALGEIEDTRAVTPLTRLLRDDPDPGVRRAAALALGNNF